MIDSRKISDLHPKVQEKCNSFIDECRQVGIPIVITSTLRDIACQDELFKIGRTVKGNDVSEKRPMGRKVTNARGGESFHNYSVAFDFVPLRNGKAVWGMLGDGIDDDPTDDATDDLELWQRVGAIAEQCGLEWAGRWDTFKEMAHCQYTGGLTLDDFKAGKTL